MMTFRCTMLATPQRTPLQLQPMTCTADPAWTPRPVCGLLQFKKHPQTGEEVGCFGVFDGEFLYYA